MWLDQNSSHQCCTPHECFTVYKKDVLIHIYKMLSLPLDILYKIASQLSLEDLARSLTLFPQWSRLVCQLLQPFRLSLRALTLDDGSLARVVYLSFFGFRDGRAIYRQQTYQARKKYLVSNISHQTYQNPSWIFGTGDLRRAYLQLHLYP